MELITLLIATFLVSLVAFILLSGESKEPITMSAHPIFGHMLGMIRHGTRYPVLLGEFATQVKLYRYRRRDSLHRQQNDHSPIYAIRTSGERIHTVNSPDLAGVVMRKQRHLDNKALAIIHEASRKEGTHPVQRRDEVN
jgi:hypothetical protein